MQHTVYKITNTLNGMVYVGKHSTDNFDDGYMGSSLILNEAIQKDGLRNFKKEIVFSSDYEEEALAFEAGIVNQAFVDNPRTYNNRVGGTGSWTLKGHKNFAKEDRINKWEQSIFGKNISSKGKDFEW
jgi:hypothetical protein